MAAEGDQLRIGGAIERPKEIVRQAITLGARFAFAEGRSADISADGATLTDKLFRTGAMLMRPIILVPVLLFVAVFALPVLANQFFFRTVEYSFRLTFTVEVDGQKRDASNVIHVTNRQPPTWLATMFNLESRVDGDAVFLDLGPRGNIIETLTFGPTGKLDLIGRIVLKVFDVRIFDVDEQAAAKHPLPPLGSHVELKGADIPTLVTFADVNDPKTARVVRPEDFAKFFGAGVQFRGASIEMTNDPVTRTIDKALPLMRGLRERARAGGFIRGPEYTSILDDLSRGQG